MSRLSKQLDNQEKINSAVKYIMEYFGGEEPYSFHIEKMLDAQTQIIALMDLVRIDSISNPNIGDEIDTDEIPEFLRNVRLYLKMLKPFAELLGQAGFANEEK